MAVGYAVPTMEAEVEKVPLLGYRCLRCGHEWLPRGNGPPKVCPNPKCKSPYWHKPRNNAKDMHQSEGAIE